MVGRRQDHEMPAHHKLEAHLEEYLRVVSAA